jgi:hypothetical protein
MKKYYGLFLLAGVVGFSSCLKERPNLDPKESNNVLEIYEVVPVPTASPNDASFPLYTSSFDISPSAPFEVKVSYSGSEVAPQDIVVTLALDEEALDTYNDEQHSEYEFVPAVIYSVDNWTVTIPKGQRVATKVFTFKPDQFDPSLTYGFPIKIVSATMGTISTNFGTVIYAFGAKNKYDGVYESTFKHSGWAAFGIYDGEAVTYGDFELITTGAGSVKRYNVGRGDELLPGISVDASGNLGATAFGAVTPIMTFDPATDKLVSVTNSTAPDARNRVLKIDPAVTDSRFDPDTKTIYAAYILQQTGRPDLVYRDTLTYIGSR